MVAVTHPGYAKRQPLGNPSGTQRRKHHHQSHTVGCNANEDNGALASWHSRSTSRRYRHGAPAQSDFPHDDQTLWPRVLSRYAGLDRRIRMPRRNVACVTIEYLGATGWIDDSVANVYKPTGEDECAPAYTPLRAQGQLWLKAVQGTMASNTYAQQADQYAGGGPAFHRGGIPCIPYIATPQYLSRRRITAA